MSKDTKEIEEGNQNKRRKRLEGTVVKQAGEKTTVVKVVKISRHPKYAKKMVKTKRYLVHDLDGRKEGEQVVIEEARPMSKRKRWKMVKNVKEKAA